MKIAFSLKNISLNSNQKDYIEKKIQHLSTLLKKIEDSSSKVDIEITKTNATIDNIALEVNITVPNKLIRAEVLAKTPEEAIDLCEEKLKGQIEKYKAKFIVKDMHSRQKVDIDDMLDNSDEFADLIE